MNELFSDLKANRNRDATSVRLSPIKRKRPESQLHLQQLQEQLPTVPDVRSAMRNNTKIPTPTRGEPVFKKTRFAIDMDTSDDDLDIIHE